MTWGNRPEEKPSTDLGIAPVKGDGVDVAVPSTDQDINAAYDDAVHVLANKPPPEVKTVNPEEKMNDSYRAIRTNASLYFIADIGSPSRASLTCWTGCAGLARLDAHERRPRRRYSEHERRIERHQHSEQRVYGFLAVFSGWWVRILSAKTRRQRS